MRKKDFIAIQMRFEGKTSKEIGKEIGRSPGTVDNWFSQEGRLLTDYKKYAEETAKIINHESATVIARSVKKAAEVIVRLLEHENVYVQFKVAKEIIDRVMGEPKKSLEISAKKSFTDLMKEIEQEEKESKEQK